MLLSCLFTHTPTSFYSNHPNSVLKQTLLFFYFFLFISLSDSENFLRTRLILQILLAFSCSLAQWRFKLTPPSMSTPTPTHHSLTTFIILNFGAPNTRPQHSHSPLMTSHNHHPPTSHRSLTRRDAPALRLPLPSRCKRSTGVTAHGGGWLIPPSSPRSSGASFLHANSLSLST